MKVNYAIVFVSDMDKSVAFYRDVVGFSLKFQSPGWSEFISDGATLALHVEEAPGRCRPGFSVPKLDEFHQRMVERGVRCLQEPRVVFGARLAQYVDPDGLAFSVAEEKSR
jgi:lactoylglutathione lyase